MYPYQNPGMYGQDDPLASRLLEDMPGFAALVGLHANRGANTIIRGGYLDETLRFDKEGNVKSSKMKRARMERYRTFQGGEITAASEKQYLGRGRVLKGRTQRLMNEGTAGATSARRINNVTARPRAFGRFHSATALTSQAYSPFQGAAALGKTKFGKSFAEKRGLNVAQGESVFGPGLLSFVTAGRKADRLEKRGAKRRLKKTNRTIESIARVNNPSLFGAAAPDRFSAPRVSFKEAHDMGLRARGGLGAQEFSDSTRTLIRGQGKNFVEEALQSGTRGARGNLMASSMAGSGSRYMAGYARGALGFGNVAGLQGEALKGARMARVDFAKGLRSKGLHLTSLNTTGKGALAFADDILEKGVFKTLGAKGTFKALTTAGGAKVLGARAAALAIPGLNVVAAASVMYDIGKMGGEIVKSGINLARDAATSMKGSITKPLFGMGYRDTEAAATSRARGVMAIQNSRLNARSALGSEASMMAAHFG